MTVFAFGAAKAAPGVTTTVLALAARWPSDREAIVVEADPSGGDLVAWLVSGHRDATGLRDSPSTVQLAATCRSGVSDHAVLEHLQRLPGPAEVRVLVGPSSPFAASTAMTSLAAAGFAEALDRFSGADVLVDLGRIDATAPTMSLLCSFRSVILVSRTDLSSVLHTRDLAWSLQDLGVRSSLLIIGDSPYSSGEVVEAVGAARLLSVFPDDPIGARALRGEARSAKVLGRTRLLRVASDVARGLVPEPASPPAPPTVGASISLPDEYWKPVGDTSSLSRPSSGPAVVSSNGSASREAAS